MSRFATLLVLLLALPLTLGCGGSSVTELLIVVDTNMTVPGEIDDIQIDVIGPNGTLRRATGSIDTADDLPQTLGLVHTSGPLGTVQVTVTGSVDNTRVV
jgi:hypothetical protein